MGFANEVYRVVNDDMTTPYLFRFAIPLMQSDEFIGQKAYDMAVTNILSYLEMHVNQTDTSITESKHRLNNYIGIVIENAIYDVFTTLDGTDLGALYYDDMDEWILSNHDTFRRSLYVFTTTVITECVPQLLTVTRAFKEMGAHVTPFCFRRNLIDRSFLEVSCYLEKTKIIL